MRYVLFFICGLFLSASIVSAEIALTQEQYDNVGIVDRELRRKDSNYNGMSGMREKMSVHGISDEQAKKLIDRMNITALKASDPWDQKMKRIVANLRAAGLNDETLEYMGFIKGGE